MLLFIFCRVKRCISFLAFAGVGLYQPFIFDIKTNRHRGLKRRWSFNHEKITCGPKPSSNIIHLPIMSEPSKLSSFSKVMGRFSFHAQKPTTYWMATQISVWKYELPLRKILGWSFTSSLNHNVDLESLCRWSS